MIDEKDVGDFGAGIRECPQEPSVVQLRAWIEHIRADVKAGLAPYDSSFDEALRLIEMLQTWRPIETAPTDGTEVIGLYHRPPDGLFGETNYGPWTMAFERGEWRSSWDRSRVIEYMSDFGTEYKDLDMEPTHWMPLPPFGSGRILADATPNKDHPR